MEYDNEAIQRLVDQAKDLSVAINNQIDILKAINDARYESDVKELEAQQKYLDGIPIRVQCAMRKGRPINVSDGRITKIRQLLQTHFIRNMNREAKDGALDLADMFSKLGTEIKSKVGEIRQRNANANANQGREKVQKDFYLELDDVIKSFGKKTVGDINEDAPGEMCAGAWRKNKKVSFSKKTAKAPAKSASTKKKAASKSQSVKAVKADAAKPTAKKTKVAPKTTKTTKVADKKKAPAKAAKPSKPGKQAKATKPSKPKAEPKKRFLFW